MVKGKKPKKNRQQEDPAPMTYLEVDHNKHETFKIKVSTTSSAQGTSQLSWTAPDNNGDPGDYTVVIPAGYNKVTQTHTHTHTHTDIHKSPYPIVSWNEQKQTKPPRNDGDTRPTTYKRKSEKGFTKHVFLFLLHFINFRFR